MRANPLIPAQKRRREQLRAICRQGNRRVLEKFSNVGHIDPIAQRAIEKQLHQLLQQIVQNVDQHIRSSIITMIEQTISHYVHLTEQQTGLTVPLHVQTRTFSEVQRIIFTALFRGNVYGRRIQNIERRVRINLYNRLRIAVAQGLRGREIGNLLAECFFSPDPVIGSSLIGGMERILVSEENRAYHIAATSLFRDIGVGLVRFHLTRELRPEGIVDDIARHVDSVVASRTHLNPRGLYRLEHLPHYPRPRAVYYLEPIFEERFFPLI